MEPPNPIAQLEPCPAPGSDPFERLYLEEPPPVLTNQDGSINSEIERLINKRVVPKGRGFATEYLVNWRGYGPQCDRWYKLKELQDAQELVNVHGIFELRTLPLATPFINSKDNPRALRYCSTKRSLNTIKLMEKMGFVPPWPWQNQLAKQNTMTTYLVHTCSALKAEKKGYYSLETKLVGKWETETRSRYDKIHKKDKLCTTLHKYSTQWQNQSAKKGTVTTYMAHTCSALKAENRSGIDKWP